VKTISLKKVSAVAVASLGFGLLSVVPAQAATTTATATNANQDVAVGTAITAIVVGATVSANTSNAATVTLTVPAGSLVTMADNDGAGSGSTPAAAATPVKDGTVITASAVTRTSTYVDTYAMTGASAAAGTFASYVIKPDVPGLYTLLVDSEGNASNDVTAYVKASGAAGTVGTGGLGTTSITATAGGQAAFTFTNPNTDANGSVYNITYTGVGSILTATGVRDDGTTGQNPTTLNGSAADFSAGAKLTLADNTGSAVATFTVASAVAGVQTFSISKIDSATGSPTLAATVTITWGASPVLSPALSRSIIEAGTTTGGTADATILVPKAAVVSNGGQNATITVRVNDSAGTNITSTSKITASISGPGMLGINGTAGSVALSGRSITGTAGQDKVGVFADGTEGKATITISVGTTVIATETVSFYGAVAKVVATQGLSNPLANGFLLGSANATSGTTMRAAASFANEANGVPAVVLTLTDASGNLIPSQAANISAVSSDATVMSKTITAVEDTTAAVGAGNYNASVSSASGSAAGKSATLTFRVLLADGVTYVSSAPVTFTTGSNKISKVTVSFDKTTYTAGDPAVMTVKATDAAGLAVADGLYASSTYSAPLFSKSIVAISTMPTDSTMVTVGGKKDYKFYAPAVPGAFTATATYINSDAGLVPTTGTASVTDGNAAIITQIDALNAKIVALNALIAKIMKKLGVR
jgi:hypothetical protein